MFADQENALFAPARRALNDNDAVEIRPSLPELFYLRRGLSQPGGKLPLFDLDGQDVDAVQRARTYFTGYSPSSPQIALLKDGQLVYMLERHQIEGRTAEDIAKDLTRAFDKYCEEATTAA